MLVVYFDGSYYIVDYDATLRPVSTDNLTFNDDESVKTVEMVNPLFWTYSENDGNASIWYNRDARTYTWTSLPEAYIRRYINPHEGNGYLDINDNQTDIIAQQNVQYNNYHIQKGSEYLGIKSVDGELHICGTKNNQNDAATIYLAEALSVGNLSVRNHMVNHIDISVEGKAGFRMPLAYGTYKLEYIGENNEPAGFYQNLVVSRNQPYTSYTEQKVDITDEDLRKASVTTSIINSEGRKENINNTYIVTGYSKNKKDDSAPDEEDKTQVRLEGTFKVANLPPVPDDLDPNDPEWCAKRIANKIYYDLAVKKPVTFRLLYTDPETKQQYIIMKNDTEPFDVTIDLDLVTSFDFWDPDNECPGVALVNSREQWLKGLIPDNESWEHQNHHGVNAGPGMDFKMRVLTNDSNTSHEIVAIEVTKYIEGDNGTEDGLQYLSLPEKTECLIHVYQGEDENNCNNETHTKTLQVGTDGIGLFYDYDVTGGTYDQPAYVKVSEDVSTVQDVLVDSKGKRWKYDRSQVDTEWVWRNSNHASMHSKDYDKDNAVGGQFYSDPEIIGEYRSDELHDGTYDRFNGFLEFYIYNIYKPAGYLKVHKIVTANDLAPVSTGEKKALAGTYEFTVYTDEDCSKPYYTDSESGRVPLKLTVEISEDGNARDSKTVELPIGDYWIKETTPGEGITAKSEIVKVTVGSDTTESAPASADFTNNIETGSLTVGKTVTGAYTATGTDIYDITIKNGSKYVSATLNGSIYSYDELTDVETSYQIKADQTLTFEHLPVGQYTVTEKTASKQGYAITTSYRVDNNQVATATAEIRKKNTTTVEIENHYRKAELVITKTINGMDEAEIPKAAGLITITVTDNDNHSLLSGVKLTESPFQRNNNTYTAVLSSTDSATYAQYLVPDGIYTVTETMTAPVGYTMTSSKYSVTAKMNTVQTDAESGTGYQVQLNGADASAGKIDYTNTYQRDTGSLYIEKKVTVNGQTVANTNLVDGDYRFRIASDDGVYPVTSKYVFITITNGGVTAVSGDGTLDNGKAKVDGLPTGKYTVTEILSTAQQNKGITFTASNNVSVDVAGTTIISTATFTNDIKVGGLKISKNVKIGNAEASGLTDSRKKLADGTYTFNIYTDSDAKTLATKADGTPISDVKVVIENGVAKDAAVVKDLLPGEYWIKETAGSNSAVNLDETTYKAVITAGSTGVVTDPDITAVTNVLPVGSLEVTKSIQAYSGEALSSEAEYPVVITVSLKGNTYYVQSNNGELGTTAPTDTLKIKAGTPLVISNLPYGEYLVTESNPGEIEIPGYSYVNKAGTSNPSDTAIINETQGSVGLVNVYVADTSWTPQVGKLLNGQSYHGTEFEYGLESLNGDSYTDTVNNTVNGTVSFKPITYNNDDAGKEFIYRIFEAPGTDGHIHYDNNPIYAKVIVNNDNGSLTATGKYYSNENCTEELSTPAFSNYEFGTLTIKKTVTGDYETDDNYYVMIMFNNQYAACEDQAGTYVFNEFTERDQSFVFRNGETLTFTGLPVGTYTVFESWKQKTQFKETENGVKTPDGYMITTTYKVGGNEMTAKADVAIDKQEPAEVEVINYYRKAELVITKTIDGVDPTEAAGRISISVSDTKGNKLLDNVPLNQSPFTSSGSAYSATIRSTDSAEYAQYLEPYGTYIVTETMTAPDGYTLTDSKYSVTAKENIANAEAKSGNGYTLQLTGDDISTGKIEYTNKYKRDKGSLNIAKTVTVNGETVPGTKIVDGEYHFTVKSDSGVTPEITKQVTITITNGSITAVSGDGNLVDGMAKVTDLPTGTYTVSEELTDEQNSKRITSTSHNNTSISVLKDNDANIPIVSFVNNINVGSLKITKKVNLGSVESAIDISTLPDTDARKTMADGVYTFKVYADHDLTKPAVKADGTPVGDVTVEIANGKVKEDAEVTDLLPGPYFVIETSGSNPAVQLTTAQTILNVESGKVGGNAVAKYTNVLKTGEITITKEVQDSNGQVMDVAASFPVIIKVVLNGSTYYVQNTEGELGSSAPNPSLEVSTNISGLTIKNLPFNSYIVTESNPGAVAVPAYSYVNVAASKPSATVNVSAEDNSEKLVNVYVKNATWTPQVGKLLNDQNYNGSEFSYHLTLRDEAGTLIEEVNNTDHGTVSFNGIEYKSEDADKTFKYLITEEKGDNPNITYDSATIYAKVEVSYEGTDLKAVGKYYSDEACTKELETPAFSNYELGELSVTKKVTGAYTATEADTYFFTLMRGTKYVSATVNGNTSTYAGLTDTKTRYYVNPDQTITFEKLPVGEYTVTEESTTKPGYTITTTYKNSKDNTNTARIMTIGEKVELEISNHYRIAELVITKKIDGVDPTEAAKLITISVADMKGNKLLENVSLNQSPFISDDNTYTATLRSTDNAEYAQYLVPDGEYRVTETINEPDGYGLENSTYSVKAKTSVTGAVAVSGTAYPVQLNETENAYTGEIDFNNTYKKADQPHKAETSPSEGINELGAVKFGDKITYEISYRNYKNKPTKVVITDALDSNVEYISSDPSGTYDENKHSVVWTLNPVAADKEDKKVKLTVRVKDEINTTRTIKNQAKVAVDNDTAQETEVVENPVPEKPTKQETKINETESVGNGEKGAVKVGDKITYEITVKNYKGTEATIHIEDPEQKRRSTLRTRWMSM